MKTWMWVVLGIVCFFLVGLIFWRMAHSKVVEAPTTPTTNTATSTGTNLPDTGIVIPQGMDKG